MRNPFVIIGIVIAVFVAIYAILIALFGFADPNSLVDVVREGKASVSGFWSGLWHGFVAPIAFIAKLLGFEVGIYDVNNNGGWYDFGFLLGVGAFARGASSSSSSH
jgi:hypothetical protein